MWGCEVGWEAGGGGSLWVIHYQTWGDRMVISGLDIHVDYTCLVAMVWVGLILVSKFGYDGWNSIRSWSGPVKVPRSISSSASGGGG